MTCAPLLRRRSFFLAIVLACSCLVSAVAHANGGPKGRTFGLGLQLGVPSGITGKVFLGNVVALQFGAGVYFPFAGVGGWFDVVFHFVKFHHKREDVLRISLYAGPGLSVGFAGVYYYQTHPGTVYAGSYVSGPAQVALRAPIGVAIHWQKYAFDTFAEVAPGIVLFPWIYFTPSFAVGARYYF